MVIILDFCCFMVYFLLMVENGRRNTLLSAASLSQKQSYR